MLLPSTTALPCHDTAKMILALFGRTRNLSLLRRLSASGSKNFEITAATLGVRRLGAFSQRNGRVEEKRIDTPLPPADPVSALDGGAADDDSDVAPLATLAKKRGPGAWPDKSNIYALSDEQVKEWIAQHKLQPYRARQLRQWVYGSRISSWENFRGFPKEESALLAQQFTIGGALRLVTELVSQDGTRKRLYRLHDGSTVESVLMPYKDGRMTACISSQAGCAMGCTFCATGQMGFKRQLSAVEIFEQVILFDNELRAEQRRLSNVVFMGMGEPLANFRNVVEAVKRINTDLGIGMRHITISTVGLAPKILKLAEALPQVNLAISLHTPFNDRRSEIMPINKKYGIGAVMAACAEYVKTTNRRVSFEYALIAGVNDSEETAVQLAQLLSPLGGLAHLNVIPLNPTRGYNGEPAKPDMVDQFAQIVRAGAKISVTVRVRRGIDIDAGCGQLAAQEAAQCP